MPNLNKVMLMGNLTADVEVKYTPKGTAVGSFGLAINRQWKTETGEKKEDVTFVGCVAYGKTAEIIAEHVGKGRPLYVEGRLTQETWDDKTTGQKRSKTKVVVESFQFIGGKPGEMGERSERPAGQHSAPAASRPPARAPRPPADPDLDAAPDDIPF